VRIARLVRAQKGIVFDKTDRVCYSALNAHRMTPIFHTVSVDNTKIKCKRQVQINNGTHSGNTGTHMILKQ